MKITQEKPRVSTPGAIQIRIDPHDGRCHGDHDVILLALPSSSEPGRLRAVSLLWGLGVMVSPEGSEEFLEAVKLGIEIARQIERDGEYRP